MVHGGDLAECVINISDGRDGPTIEAVTSAGGAAVLDVHSDREHNRSVVTLGGPLELVEVAARQVVAAAVARIDLRTHTGVHPRFGAADVVPFVPLSDPVPGPLRADVVAARDRHADWAGTDLDLPCFLYGPERTLPEVRRQAFRSLRPDTGPPDPHPTAGAAALGARPVLIAYNVWIAGPPAGDPESERDHALAVARSLAARLRGPAVRSLGLAVDAGAQVSFNLVGTESVSVASLYDAVAAGAESGGCSVLRAELVGLLPSRTLEDVPRHRWPELDIDEDRTIESRLQDGLRPAPPGR